MKLRAVAWDVDGTLVDSESLHHRALLVASKNWGVDFSDIDGERFRGVHIEDVWNVLRSRLPQDLAQAEWIAAITDHYIAHRAELLPLPGALETVEALAARGIPQACVSNSHRRIVEANLDALGVLHRMQFVVALDDVTAGKPDPEPYRRAAAGFGFPPAAVLAVEDSRAGTRSAIAAGLHVALCESVDEQWPESVTVISRLAEILDWFDPLND